MKKLEIFLDSANLQEIKKIDFITIDGITTNPSLAAKNINNPNKMEAYCEILKQICQINSGPVSAEVIATEYHEMIKEALFFSKIANNIIIKLPITHDGLKACKTLSEKYNLKTNMTLCFSPTQALLCAQNGATYISPFIGRLDDIGLDGTELIKDIKQIFTNYSFNTKILAASVRDIGHVIEMFKIGVDAITMPANLLEKLYKHPLTDQGIQIFLKDWNH